MVSRAGTRCEWLRRDPWVGKACATWSPQGLRAYTPLPRITEKDIFHCRVSRHTSHCFNPDHVGQFGINNCNTILFCGDSLNCNPSCVCLARCEWKPTGTEHSGHDPAEALIASNDEDRSGLASAIDDLKQVISCFRFQRFDKSIIGVNAISD